MSNNINELSEAIIKSFFEILKKWLRDHPEDSYINIAQQLYLAGGRIRAVGFEFQERYRKDL